MARLPTPGGDDGQWGAILNDYLLQIHDANGQLKHDSVDANNLNTSSAPSANQILQYDGSSLTWSSALNTKADDSTVVHNTGNETVAGTKTFSNSPVVPDPTATGQAANKDYVDSFIPTFNTKTADQASTSATYADITSLGLNVGVGAYEFSFLLPYTGSDNNNSGIKLRLNGPTSSFLSYNIIIQNSNTQEIEFFHDTFASESIGNTIITAGNRYTARIVGYVVTTASGILQPQFGIIVGGTTTTVKAGSFGKLVFVG